MRITLVTMDVMLPQEYLGFGLRFQYPDDWELSEEVTEEEVSVTVTSPETAFWSATVVRHRPDPQSVLRAALLAYEEMYDELDISEAEAPTTSGTAYTAEVNFVCMELTNTAILKAVRTPACTLLVLYQFNDAEQESVLKRISNSLVVESGGD